MKAVAPLDRKAPASALLLLVILTLVWGTNWPLFPFAVREVSVWTFRAFTVLLSGVVLLAVARARGLSLAIGRRHWGTMVAAAMCYLVVWNIASAYSAILIASGQSAVLGFTMPLWVAFIGWALLGERLTPRLLLALALGVGAVLLLMVPGLKAYAQAPMGFALGLVAAIGWAVGTIIIKRRPVAAPAIVFTAWQLLITGVPISLVALLIGDGHWFVPRWQSVVVIGYIALIPMAVGNVCWFAIVERLPANVAGLSSTMVPVVAMISGAIVLDEPLGPMQWTAMACSVAALALALYKPRAARA